MIKKLVAALTGIPEDWESQESEDSWEMQRELDEADLQGDEDDVDPEFYESFLEKVSWFL